MVDFSITSLTAPFIPPANRYFYKATRFIARRHPHVDAPKINHDLKALMFNGATALMASTVSMAYFKIIALVTAVALVVLFYLARRIIAGTILPPEPPREPPGYLKEVTEIARSHLPEQRPMAGIVPQEKSLRERIIETLWQDDNIAIGTIVMMKLTYYPSRQLIGMLLTRSP
jgi:hypothetical protein